MPTVDIVITNYNRAELVQRAIESARKALQNGEGKVIVVDDASTDDSIDLLKKRYANNAIELVVLPVNTGVTGAKNAGLLASQANWAIILDSDDEIIPGAWAKACEILTQNTNAPLVLFRCIDHEGYFVGMPFDSPQTLTLRRFLKHTSYGEVLVAVNKKYVSGALYDEDLRGSERVGCARAIKRFGPAILSPLVLRMYDQSRQDRLSCNMNRRALTLAKTHLRMLQLFCWDMDMATRLKASAKIFIYSVLAALQTRRS